MKIDFGGEKRKRGRRRQSRKMVEGVRGKSLKREGNPKS